MSDNKKVISIKGAKVHNLKDVSIDIYRNKLTVISGVSGSGKSSLAFDTLYAEGQRRFVESLSSYARQFLERMAKPDCESIIGIPPAIAIQQNTFARNPRSTVGTTTEIYDFFRLLFGRIGQTICYSCGKVVKKDNTSNVLKSLEQLEDGEKIYISFAINNKDYNSEVLAQNLKEKGFFRVINNTDYTLFEIDEIEDDIKISFEHFWVLVDRAIYRNDKETLNRIADSLDLAFKNGNGTIQIIRLNTHEVLKFSSAYECADCEIIYEEPDPKLFSFNNPQGACHKCQGFGRTVGIDEDLVVPDKSISIRKGAIHPFKTDVGTGYQRDLLNYCLIKHIDPDIPYSALTDKQLELIWEGDSKTGFNGINGFFETIEDKSFKLSYRVILTRYRAYTKCRSCGGSRLRTSARQVYVAGKNIPELVELPLGKLFDFFRNIKLTEFENEVVEQLLSEINWRLGLLVEIGLEYLNLSRLSHTLSGGESQRINLSTALGSSLVGTLYVLDEPSIGLHSRDTERLLNILFKLRNLGNTVVVVEHDPDVIRRADRIVDIGPKAGSFGGEVVFDGTFDELLQNTDSITAQYITGKKKIEKPNKRRVGNSKSLAIIKAKENNLKIDRIDIPLGRLVVVTGVSGSGKSTLINDILYASLKKMRGGYQGTVGKHEAILGYTFFQHIEMVDQTKIGTSSRSTPATYTKAFDYIRELFANTQAGRQLGVKAGYFSFNVPGGRCDACEGEGVQTIDMQFLPDVTLLCDTCKGSRYKKEATNILYRNKSIVDVLEMTIDEAIEFFADQNKIVSKLQTLNQVGLGYLKLGQPSSMLSGGESQRIKLAGHLDINDNEETLFIFDEPTTGLHLDDIAKLIDSFNKLADNGHSLIIIEHNLAVIEAADFIIDLGPEGGIGGGKVIATGTPEDIIKKDTYTSIALREYISKL
ncbi:MAG TPA: excinuclease ABC subunit UvrA [Candidatus Kapabacteria bacterium]|nr:excinuclease ABC subunit UvrA [Candidatus Kapabacteria bacterium]